MTRCSFNARWMVVALVALSALMYAGREAKAANANPGAIPPEANAFGGYGQLTGKWWNWSVRFPAETNPVLDTTGEFCHMGQEGNVWFLAGTFGITGVERTCTIPSGTAVFFPAFNSAWWNPDDVEFSRQLVSDNGGDPTGMSVEEVLRFSANYFADLATVHEATLDGVPLTPYRVESPPGGFVHSIPENNVFGIPPGDRDPTVTAGYWLLLAPLSRGTHTLNIHGAVPAIGFETEVTYNLIVAGGRSAPSAVPEPSSFALLGIAMAAGVVWRWRRRGQSER